MQLLDAPRTHLARTAPNSRPGAFFPRRFEGSTAAGRESTFVTARLRLAEHCA